MRRIEPNIGLKIKFLGIELKFYYGLYSYNLLKYYYEIQCDLVFPIKPLQQLLDFGTACKQIGRCASMANDWMHIYFLRKRVLKPLHHCLSVRIICVSSGLKACLLESTTVCVCNLYLSVGMSACISVCLSIYLQCISHYLHDCSWQLCFPASLIATFYVSVSP